MFLALSFREKQRRSHRGNVILTGANYGRIRLSDLAGSVIMYYAGAALSLLQPCVLSLGDFIS